jgi:hypothetical protein
VVSGWIARNGLRIYVCLRGFTWVYVGLRGFTWVYVGLRGFTWVYVGIALMRCYEVVGSDRFGLIR